MVTRNSNVCLKNLHQKHEAKNRVVWNRVEEIAKVFQTGLALGVDFLGKTEAIMETVASRKNENDNRFRALARSLVFKFKPIVS